MAMQWKYSNGYDTSEFTTAIEFDDDVELTEEQKDLFLLAIPTASAKTITLGLSDNQPMFVIGTGSYSCTIANLEGDTGETVKNGEVWLAIGSTDQDATTFTKLYGASEPA